MSVHQESFTKILSSFSSSENRDSIDTIGVEPSGRDEEFYEEIEAPKFVDFTSPDHFRPDDRFWFCQRMGCDQKHEEEMESEAIYKNFVLRVMAARSPNVKFQKLFDRNSSRIPTKCPLSAPPKSSKPRVSKISLISSFSGKMVDDKKRVVRPLLKPGSTTPITKGKPVAAKYLTTARNKKCIPNENSFRSVQHPKPIKIEVSKSQTVAKALVFRSPKKSIKLKTPVELYTPMTKLCEGMNKLEVSSQRKRVLGYSSNLCKNSNSNASRRQMSTTKVECKQTCVKREAKSARSRNSATKIKFTKKDSSMKYLGINRVVCSVTIEGGEDIKKELFAKETGEEFDELKESRQEDAYISSAVLQSMEYPGTQVTNNDEDNGNKILTSESCGNQLNENNSAEGERTGLEVMDNDDKENAMASDGNRMDNTNQEQNRRKISGMHDKSGEVKKICQAPDKHLKEGWISSGGVMKLKKPKPTNPKPFRLRTDERGILKEANLEKRTRQLAPENESANLIIPGRKLQRKHSNDEQKQGRTSKTVVSLKPVCHNSSTHEQPKPMNSPRESNSVRRSEKIISKVKSPLQKLPLQPQGRVMTKKKVISFLIPGKKLDVIYETSPEVTELRKAKKPDENYDAPNTTTHAASQSSRGRLPVTVAVEPRNCIKKLK